MSRNLSASERSSLIRLASGLPVGSPQRKAILAGLSKVSFWGTGEIEEMDLNESRMYAGVDGFHKESDGEYQGPLIAYLDLSEAAGEKLGDKIPKKYGPPSEAKIMGGSTGLYFELSSDMINEKWQPYDFALDTDLEYAEAKILMKKLIRDLTQGKIPPGYRSIF